MEDKKTVGLAFTGSYCTFSKVLNEAVTLSEKYNLIPILSDNCLKTDTRFGSAEEFVGKIEDICHNSAMKSIKDAEPIGPKKLLDVLLIAPCTGNTIAKIANGIADTTVTLAVKSQLRNNRPIVIAVSTNDGLGANAVNIGKLLARKNMYMVPFGQDDCVGKENSLVADFSMMSATIEKALEGKQIQPVLV